MGPPSRKGNSDSRNTWHKGKKSHSSSESSRGNTTNSGGSSGPRTGVLFVEVKTITARITQTMTEGKRHIKVVDMGEAVVVGEVNRAYLQAVPLNPRIKIKLRDGINTNYPTVQVRQKIPIADQEDHTVMEGSLILFNTGVKVLFDTGASHSFISTACAMSLGLKPKRLEVPISIGTPTGINVYLNRYCITIISYGR